MDEEHAVNILLRSTGGVYASQKDLGATERHSSNNARVCVLLLRENDDHILYHSSIINQPLLVDA